MDIRIDKIRLRAPGLSQQEAARLGRVVAERLGAALASTPLASTPPPAGQERIAGLRVVVPVAAGGDQDWLAAAVAAQVARALSDGLDR